MLGHNAWVRRFASRRLSKPVVFAADAVGRFKIQMDGEGEAIPFQFGGSLGHERSRRYSVTQS